MDSNINKPALTILAVIISLLGFSCNSELEEEITWQLDDYPDMLVVEATVTNRMGEQYVFLSKTGPYLDDKPAEAVSDAIVTVSDGVHNYTYTELKVRKGEYISDIMYRGNPFTTYTLSIKLSDPLNDLTEYTASTTMQEGLELDTIICEIYTMPDFGFDTDEDDPDTTLLGIYYYGKEPDNPDNYYLSVISGSSFTWHKSARDLIRFTDDENNGSESNFIMFIQNVAPKDTITFEIRSVERSYYEYIGSIQQMNQAGSAYSMSGPPANAEGNIPGALGYFSASYISVKESVAVDRRF